jgi:hypothetical protein
MPFSHLISAEAVVSAASFAGLAPSVTMLAPARVWNVASIERSVLKSCAGENRQLPGGLSCTWDFAFGLPPRWRDRCQSAPSRGRGPRLAR